MTINRKIIAATAAALSLGLGGCWDDDDDPGVTPPVVVNEVPASAGASSASFFSYLLALSGSDESSEPATIRDSFAVPADDGSEPTPVM